MGTWPKNDGNTVFRALGGGLSSPCHVDFPAGDTQPYAGSEDMLLQCDAASESFGIRWDMGRFESTVVGPSICQALTHTQMLNASKTQQDSKFKSEENGSWNLQRANRTRNTGHEDNKDKRHVQQEDPWHAEAQIAMRRANINAAGRHDMRFLVSPETHTCTPHWSHFGHIVSEHLRTQTKTLMVGAQLVIHELRRLCSSHTAARSPIIVSTHS